ncbi:hypothetical protein [Asticcacaulis sp. YBE204]|uniref:hypothetical protein n=1 Tax=Asticcacaulis sp. YBE204 TaxID=1282363 RepID=UPI0009DDE1EE|nr:hypothetical protein [Asticcacaulis sp. YBE204]
MTQKGELESRETPLNWRTENPKAIWAHHSLRSALRRGLIERKPCEVCAAVHGVNDAVIDGHHEDYDRPMDVKWLCRKHHRQIHATEKVANGQT